MIYNQKIAVIIPSYRVRKHIVKVIQDINSKVDIIIVVDDKCPEKSGELVSKYIEETNKNNIEILYNSENLGVGGAVKRGYEYAIEKEMDIFIKIDGDGQMDTSYLEKLVYKLVKTNAGYVKGNRFNDFKALRNMPVSRLLGNSVLSFLVKVCSGYWNIMDPTNGFTAIERLALQKIDLDKISNDYFFETDMLVNLNIANVPVIDLSMPAIYGDETSSLSIFKTIRKFPRLLLSRFFKRLFLKYFVHNFNMFSMCIVSGTLLFILGVSFGSYHWIINSQKNIETPTGTIVLAVLPLILSFQLFINAISIDIKSSPKIFFYEHKK